MSSKQFSESEADLVFEGLDTYCEITLVCTIPVLGMALSANVVSKNGKSIGKTDNMFHAHRIGCKAHLTEGKNELVLTFNSPWLESKKEEAANGGPMTLCELSGA